jgi:hypothetical protein
VSDRSSWLALGPRAVERRAAAGWTTVGVLDPVTVARVDGAGLVEPRPGWSLDWWVGADDRWHLPAREPAVRQRRLGPGPVLETALRVPGGDAVHRVWAINAGGGAALVVQVDNDSPLPFALALALRPYGVDGEGSLSSVAVDGPTVVADARPALWLPRPPNGVVVAAGHDVVETVLAGGALDRPGPSHDRQGRVTAAVVYPVPHRTSLRVVVPLDDRPGRRTDPAGVPAAEAVSRGWRSILDAGARVALPDPAAADRADRARVRLLLAAPGLPAALAAGAPGAGLVTAALAAGGHQGEALRAVAAVDPVAMIGADPAAVAAVAGGAAAALGLVDDPEVGPAGTEVLAGLVALIDRRRTRSAAGPALAALAAHLDRTGDTGAAGALRARAGGDAGPWTWSEAHRPQPGPGDDPVVAAAEWLALRRQVVDEAGDALVLFASFPSAWRGGVAEVHHLPTFAGRLSLALRWHGYRPALLWELQRRPGSGPVRLRCPGLDPDWSTTAERGEALLAGHPDGLARPPVEGESFT